MVDPVSCTMSLAWEQVTIDAADPHALGRWWCEALSWVVVSDDEQEFEIRPSADTTPGILYIRVPDVKGVKNRLHLDLRPDDQVAEVARLEEMGARRVDIGQGTPSWVVLEDPEGNEFCILRSQESGSVPN